MKKGEYKNEAKNNFDIQKKVIYHRNCCNAYLNRDHLRCTTNVSNSVAD